MHHQHSNKRRIALIPWNGTFRRWQKNREQQPDMGCAYRSWHITISTNRLRWGRISKNSIGEIYQIHEYSNPTPTRCTPTRQEEMMYKKYQAFHNTNATIELSWLEETFISDMMNINSGIDPTTANLLEICQPLKTLEAKLWIYWSFN